MGMAIPDIARVYFCVARSMLATLSARADVVSASTIGSWKNRERVSWTRGTMAASLLAVTLMALSVGLLGMAWLQNVPSDQTTAPQQEAAAELEALRAQIRTLEARLAELSTQRGSIVRDFEIADVQQTLERQQFSVLRHRQELLLADLQRQIEGMTRIEASLGGVRKALRQRVVALYRMGPLSYSRLLLTSETASDILARYQIVTYLAAQDRNLILSVQQSVESLRQARDSMDSTNEELEQLMHESLVVANDLESDQQQRQDLLRRVDRESESQRLVLQETQRVAVELERLVSSLSSESGATSSSVAPFAAAQGQLPWPVEGPLLSKFGRRLHPVYETVTLSKGIEIVAKEGTSVRALFDGTVRFADWFTGYGLVVILDHGDSFISLYGHLRAIGVAVGQRIEAGAAIGTVGNTGSITGYNLYLELREGTNALDPVDWLRER